MMAWRPTSLNAICCGLWRAVPAMPIEIMLLPKWFPFHLDKISYWSRTVIVPLLVLMAKKPQARNNKGVRIDELFLEPPQTLGPAPKAPQQKASWFLFFRAVDNVLRAAEPYFPKRARQRAFDRAEAWVTERGGAVKAHRRTTAGPSTPLKCASLRMTEF